MTVLHLGVIDIPYANGAFGAPTKARRIGAARRGNAAAASHPPAAAEKTTGEVAEILEAKYHIQETFFELHKEQIAESLEASLAGALENLFAGGPGTVSETAEAESTIEALFKQFLSNREMDTAGAVGVPTKAAMQGVSHRFLHPYAHRSARPSFIDTGLMQANFKAWID